MRDLAARALRPIWAGMSQLAPLTRVLYNGDCPVCSTEIGHYARYAEARALPISFDDLNKADLARWGLSPDQAARRLYVAKDGALVSGIPAFLVLWSEMPRYRWLARVVGLPGIRHLAGLVYDHALAPLIYSRHLARQARRRRDDARAAR